MGYPIRIGVKAAIVKKNKLLLVEYKSKKNGLHYNLPGGGIEYGEAIKEGLKREVYEETSCKIKVGRLLLVGEYEPVAQSYEFGKIHKLTLYFLCRLKEGSQPSMPKKPDANQIGVRWFPVDDLPDSMLPRYHNLLKKAIYGKNIETFTTRK